MILSALLRRIYVDIAFDVDTNLHNFSNFEISISRFAEYRVNKGRERVRMKGGKGDKHSMDA